jgi:hypothetical protein
VKQLPLHLGHDLPGVLLIPVAVQLLGHCAELDQEVARQALGLDLTPLLTPEADERASSLPMMMRASEPPMNERRFVIIVVSKLKL